MKILKTFSLALFAFPLSAQAWDLRLEAPFPRGQNLPQTTDQGNGQPLSGSLGSGTGAILTASHRIVRVGPVLKLEWNAELAQWRATGQIHQGAVSSSSSLKQDGIGIGANAQFWVPFTGFAGEVGVLERFQSYRYEGAGSSRNQDQEAIIKDHPVSANSTQDLGGYITSQGSGQEFQSLWTLGVGITF
jgi:hypothetical protein